jgi:hypothetical protein
MTTPKKVIEHPQRPQPPLGRRTAFPVHGMFSYSGDTKAISPFLLLDYAAPTRFEPTTPAAAWASIRIAASRP